MKTYKFVVALMNSYSGAKVTVETDGGIDEAWKQALNQVILSQLLPVTLSLHLIGVD